MMFTVAIPGDGSYRVRFTSERWSERRMVGRGPRYGQAETTCRIEPEGTAHVFVGIAYCSVSDRINHRKGRAVALRRAIQAGWPVGTRPAALRAFFAALEAAHRPPTRRLSAREAGILAHVRNLVRDGVIDVDALMIWADARRDRTMRRRGEITRQQAWIKEYAVADHAIDSPGDAL